MRDLIDQGLHIRGAQGERGRKLCRDSWWTDCSTSCRKRAVKRWAPRWFFLSIIIIDAPLLKYALPRVTDVPLCLSKYETHFLQLSMIAHLALPFGLLCWWTARWVSKPKVPAKDVNRPSSPLSKRNRGTSGEFYDIEHDLHMLPPIIPTKGSGARRSSVTPVIEWNYGGSNVLEMSDIRCNEAKLQELQNEIEIVKQELDRLRTSNREREAIPRLLTPLGAHDRSFDNVDST
mmetsp:Transcript_21708/g.49077  ORF Transcript_21708/g.49077 Transcript_21708/m.49077 type:complete len:233 (-) Transcript_21708:312-1010(-)